MFPAPRWPCPPNRSEQPDRPPTSPTTPAAGSRPARRSHSCSWTCASRIRAPPVLDVGHQRRRHPPGSLTASPGRAHPLSSLLASLPKAGGSTAHRIHQNPPRPTPRRRRNCIWWSGPPGSPRQSCPAVGEAAHATLLADVSNGAQTNGRKSMPSPQPSTGTPEASPAAPRACLTLLVLPDPVRVPGLVPHLRPGHPAPASSRREWARPGGP